MRLHLLMTYVNYHVTFQEFNFKPWVPKRIFRKGKVRNADRYVTLRLLDDGSLNFNILKKRYLLFYHMALLLGIFLCNESDCWIFNSCKDKSSFLNHSELMTRGLLRGLLVNLPQFRVWSWDLTPRPGLYQHTKNGFLELTHDLELEARMPIY